MYNESQNERGRNSHRFSVRVTAPWHLTPWWPHYRIVFIKRLSAVGAQVNLTFFAAKYLVILKMGCKNLNNSLLLKMCFCWNICSIQHHSNSKELCLVFKALKYIVGISEKYEMHYRHENKRLAVIPLSNFSKGAGANFFNFQSRWQMSAMIKVCKFLMFSAVKARN